MIVKKHRAQAALEFLTTYGWAFLLILVMIGGLSYFGVLDPSNAAPQSCVGSDGWVCEEFAVNTNSATGAYEFVVSNPFKAVTIRQLRVLLDGVNSADAPTTTFSENGEIFFVVSQREFEKQEYALSPGITTTSPPVPTTTVTASPPTSTSAGPGGPTPSSGSFVTAWDGSVPVKNSEKVLIKLNTVPGEAPQKGVTYRGKLEVVYTELNGQLEKVATFDFSVRAS